MIGMHLIEYKRRNVSKNIVIRSIRVKPNNARDISWGGKEITRTKRISFKNKILSNENVRNVGNILCLFITIIKFVSYNQQFSTLQETLRYKKNSGTVFDLR